MARVLVTRRLVGDALDRLAAAHDVEVWPEAMPPSPEALRERLAHAEGLLCLLTERVDAALLDAAPELKVVANYAVGTDNVDLEACRARGIAVGRTPDVLTDATADLAWALILAARPPHPGGGRRRAGRRVAHVRGGALARRRPGRRDARDDRVRAHRPGGRAPRRGLRHGGAAGPPRRRPARRVIARADFITLHAPLTPETRGLVGREALARVKPGALLVNTARGGLVDPEALAAALRDGRLAGAALDVTDPEPLPADHPLLDAPNLLVVPHIGSATVEARGAMTERAVANLEAGLAGDAARHLPA